MTSPKIDLKTAAIIKSILNLRCREGTTLADLEGKCQWLISKVHFLRNFLGAFHIEFQFAMFAICTDEYYDIVGEPWPMANRTIEEISTQLASIDCVYCVGPPNGTARWYVQSNNTKHIKLLILDQKIQMRGTRPRKIPKDHRSSDDQRSSDDCYFMDNVTYRYDTRTYSFKTTL